eukprot:10853824-Heterocapsa_arctica.AAC.1
MHECAQEMGVETVATGENPAPPLEEERLPLSFYLPQIKEWLDTKGIEIAEFNMCRFNTRMWKLTWWVGHLQRLRGLTRYCQCQGRGAHDVSVAKA